MHKERLTTGNIRRRKKAAIQQAALDTLSLADLHHYLGNRRVQRLLTQRDGGAFELDDETAARINRERGGGQPLEEETQATLGEALGADLGSVRVHTSPQADALSRQLGAMAFTTGRDIFFRQGAFAPHTAEGRALLAHELTHVVQQSTKGGSGSGQMTVGAADDPLEREAEEVARHLADKG